MISTRRFGCCEDGLGTSEFFSWANLLPVGICSRQRECQCFLMRWRAKEVVSDFGRRAGGWMRGFFEADFAAISTLLLPCMPLWLGTHGWLYRRSPGKWREVWKCELQLSGRSTGSTIAWTEERESVMITIEGDWGSGPERIVSRQWKMARSLAVKIEAEFRSLKLVLSTEYAIPTRIWIRDPSA